jgi:ketosteroid isomerase-like protein
MDAVFWDDPQVLRFGIAEIQYGFEQIAEWRRAAVPVPRSRVCVRRDVVRIADGVVAVDIVFRNGDDPMLGRQSQVWVRHPDGWRIVRAHVSMMPLTP